MIIFLLPSSFSYLYNLFIHIYSVKGRHFLTWLFFTGLVDPSELLANIEAQITKVKDEALSRKEVTDRIDKWLSACEEENWLEDYNQVSRNFTLFKLGVSWLYMDGQGFACNFFFSLVFFLLQFKYCN